MPSSHTGGRRYFQENFQDPLAVAHVYDAPDLFSTFTCNPKWPEITKALLFEPGQKPHDRADIVVRVYNMKLNEYLDDIKSGRAYGAVKAGSVFVFSCFASVVFTLFGVLLCHGSNYYLLSSSSYCRVLETRASTRAHLDLVGHARY